MSEDHTSVRTLFMGSPEYAAVIMKKLIDCRYNLVGVVTQPDKRVGRGNQMESPPVKITADSNEIPSWQPKSLRDGNFFEILNEIKPDLIIVAAYGKILRSELLNYPKYGCINVHASLLPRWRGASPIQAAILHGDNESGVSIMKMDEGIDTGGIIAKRTITLAEKETGDTLTAKLADLGAELLVETLPAYLNGEIKLKKQNEEEATYAGLIKKADGRIDFNLPAAAIERMTRAYNPWPSAFFEWNGKNVKVYSAKVMKSHHLTVSEHGVMERFPCVGTSTKDLMLLELQVPGKNRVSGKVFLNGARDWL